MKLKRFAGSCACKKSDRAKVTIEEIAGRTRAGEALVAGGVPHKSGGKVCLHFGEAVGDFGADSHLFWLVLRVRGRRLWGV